MDAKQDETELSNASEALVQNDFSCLTYVVGTPPITGCGGLIFFGHVIDFLCHKHGFWGVRGIITSVVDA